MVVEEGPLNFVGQMMQRASFLAPMQRKTLCSHFLKREMLPVKSRKNVWLLLAGAHANAARHPGYYAQLTAGFGGGGTHLRRCHLPNPQEVYLTEVAPEMALHITEETS